MNKDSDPLENKYELWTFNDSRNTFYIKKNNNLFHFKVCNIFTNQWHESEEIQLQKINQKTIKAAFDSKMDAVSYEMTQITQTTINLRFKVKIHQLLQEFSEDIELKEVQMDKKQSIELQMNELFAQTQKFEKLIDVQLQKQKISKILEKQEFSSRNGPMFEVNLKPGKYIFSVTGIYIIESLFNEEYYEQYDQFGNYCGRQCHTLLKLTINFGQNIQLQFISTFPRFDDPYEYPYFMTGVLNIEKEQNVNFVFGGFKNHDAMLLNSNILTIIPVRLNNG